MTALRSRIIERFGELETERAGINTKLTALERHTGHDNDPTLPDQLPQIPVRSTNTRTPPPQPSTTVLRRPGLAREPRQGWA